ncbi:hypothetical protein [Pseudomonas sp.]|uniref:hypothetical protein n=1 Tax=Pseudomonas sp. TaxID=306 RepID=UPI00289EBC0A|nr:hypothetical protein [Pseudomonas sp.]
MRKKTFAVAVVIDGRAEGFEPVSNQREGMRQAKLRSQSSHQLYCIIQGEESMDYQQWEILKLFFGGIEYQEKSRHLRILKRDARYLISALRHLLEGKLTCAHFIYAIKSKPVAVGSKGHFWIIDPEFEM